MVVKKSHAKEVAENSLRSEETFFRSRQLRKGTVLGCLVLAFGTYVRACSFGFIYDDHSQIVTNPQLKSVAFLTRMFFQELWSQKGPEHIGSYYRPIFSFWLFIVHSVGGLSNFAWHLSSIALHLSVVYTFFHLSVLLLEDFNSALFSTALFAVHPINIES